MQTLNWILTLFSNMSLTVQWVISLRYCVWCYSESDISISDIVYDDVEISHRLVVGTLRLDWISRILSGRTIATSHRRVSRRNSQWESHSWRSHRSSSSPSRTPWPGGATWTEEWFALSQGHPALHCNLYQLSSTLSRALHNFSTKISL